MLAQKSTALLIKNAKHVWPGGRQTDSRVTRQTKQTRTRKMQGWGERRAGKGHWPKHI